MQSPDSQPIRTGIIALALGAVFCGICVAHDEDSEKAAQSLSLFKTEVRAIFLESCVKCHGGEKTRSGFDLTTRDGLLSGGEMGVSVVAGNSKQSPIMDYIAHREQPFMPPDKPRLSDETISSIAQWIELGAYYDKPLVENPRTNVGPMQVTDSDRQYWAFAPLQKYFPKDASIDAFIRANHNEYGLAPAPKASPRVLIRRVFFDVTGLPPEPTAIDGFLNDPSPDSYENLVDRLLASPRFGERWARHWLDIARYAESHGFEHDYDRKYAFHFRDFVIRAFNQDMPYDQFVRWQLAGDEVAPNNPLALMATGFLGAGVHPTQITIRDAERVRYDSLDDMLATTGTAMLATTIGCARCHDHKFDPIPTQDYYRLLSTFKSTVRTVVDLDLGPLNQASITGHSNHHADAGTPVSVSKVDLQKVMICSEGPHVKPLRLHTSSKSIPDLYDESYFLDRGDTNQKIAVAEPGFLQVLTRTNDSVNRWAYKSSDILTSGNRAALSLWITDVECGAGHLLARVIVNRLWHHYFGQGIVATPNNFGLQGDRPTHPELLDWLATELIRNGWRLKPIHKLILMSECYQISGLTSVENERIDPDNRFLWKRNPRRLEAEAIRDNALAVAGQLDLSMFGAGTLDETNRRRSVYFKVKRSKLVPIMQMFDWPNTLTSQGRRSVTTTPAQALVFINHPQFRRMAKGFAKRIMAEEDGIGTAYMIAYGRPPSESERVLGTEFVRRQSLSHNGDTKQALADFCAALMSSNEFIYID